MSADPVSATSIPPRVAAVVVIHNSAATLGRCIEAIQRQPALAELCIVDNGSHDGWRTLVSEESRVWLVENSGNPGFATACNQGAKCTTVDWLLFINPDCFLREDTLNVLLERARSVPTLGALGVELVDQDGNVDPASRRHAPTLASVLRKQVAIPASGASDQAVESVEAISGALMLIPRAAFDHVGGFDTDYRLHCEDLDLCRRLIEAGYTVGVASGVRVLHLKGTSSKSKPFFVEWHKHRGMLRYFRKFDADSSPWWIRMAVPCGIALRFPLAVARAWWRARRT